MSDINIEIIQNPITIEVASNFLLTVETLNQAVSVADTLKIRFPNDSVTDDGGGTVTIDFAAGIKVITVYDTVAEMQAVTGTAGDLAYALDYVDQHWKWSVLQNQWIPAF